MPEGWNKTTDDLFEEMRQGKRLIATDEEGEWAPEVSRVNMRSVQMPRSTHHHGSRGVRASPACLGVVATGAGFASSFWFITHPLSCVPSLHGRCPFPRYYGRSDSRRAALRALPP